jgi:hypothetical protein
METEVRWEMLAVAPGGAAEGELIDERSWGPRACPLGARGAEEGDFAGARIDDAPGQVQSAPGKVESAPGKVQSAPGKVELAPGKTGNPAAEAAGSALFASQSNFFCPIAFWYVFQSHCQVGIPKVFFKLFESFPLRHDLWVFQKFSEQETFSLPVHHGQSWLHPVLSMARTARKVPASWREASLLRPSRRSASRTIGRAFRRCARSGRPSARRQRRPDTRRHTSRAG